MAVQEWAKNVTAGKMSKSDKLGQVDHSAINYPPFRRSFYIEADELKRMTEKQVADYRMQLEDVKVGHTSASVSLGRAAGAPLRI